VRESAPSFPRLSGPAARGETGRLPLEPVGLARAHVEPIVQLSLLIAVDLAPVLSARSRTQRSVRHEGLTPATPCQVKGVPELDSVTTAV
jgi:hypothetical protein